MPAGALDAEAARGKTPVLGRRRLPAWALPGFLALTVVYYGAHFLPMSQRASLVINQSAFLAPILASVVCGAAAFLRSEGTERRFWLLMSVGNTLLLGSEGYYSAYMILVDVRGPRPPSAFEYLNLAGAVVFFALLLSMTRLGSGSMAARARVVADIVGCGIVAVAVTHSILVVPLFQRFHVTNEVTGLLGAVYPVIGVIMLSGTVINILGPKISKWQPWETMTAVSIAIFAVGLVMWPLAAVSTPAGSQASLFDVAYLGGEYLLFMATVTRLTSPGASRLRAMPPPLAFGRRSNGPVAVLVPAAMLIGIPYFVLRAYEAVSNPFGYAAFGIAAATLGMLLVSRTALTAVENGHLFQRSVTDPLTGLYNHRYFHERLSNELDLAARYGEPLCVVVVDLDDFSRVNNVHGHTVGDAVLVEVAGRLRRVCREAHSACRIGGDEFGLILPETGPAQCRKVCEGVLASLRAPIAGLDRRLTASLGFASYPEDSAVKDELLRMADGAEYWAKYHGKDRVMRFDADIVDALDAQERIKRLEERSHLATVGALAAAVDARDPLTQDHSRNVAALSVALAGEIGLDADKVKLVEAAALLHDIGKIGIPDEVLKKRGPLSERERLQIEEHPLLGRRILEATNLREILPWTLSHHERWDGEGYPEGVSGEEIPLEARLLAICDAYDAMVSDRPYRRAMQVAEALHEIDLSAGTQFDPLLADIFIAMIKRMHAVAPEEGDATAERRHEVS